MHLRVALRIFAIIAALLLATRVPVGATEVSLFDSGGKAGRVHFG